MAGSRIIAQGGLQMQQDGDRNAFARDATSERDEVNIDKTASVDKRQRTMPSAAWAASR